MRDKKTFIITLFIIISLILTVMTVMASAEAKSKLSARSCALYSPNTEAFLYEKDADLRLPMASTTKIMTAIVVVENASCDDEVTVTKDAVGIEGSSLYLEIGDTVTVLDLLYALMLRSANDAAVALAVHVSGDVDSFAELMNAKAQSLGLKNTSFKNPHGLDADGHYTTAKDLAIISAELLKSPTLKEIVSTYKHTFAVSGSERTVVNHNKLLRSYDGSVGVKTGYTKKSGRCLVSAAERDGVLLIAVTLDAPDDWRDHKTILDLGFSETKTVRLSDLCDIRTSLPTVGALHDNVSISAPDKTFTVLTTDKLKARYDIPKYVAAGSKKGEVIGRITVYKNGKQYSESDVTLDEDVMWDPLLLLSTKAS